MGLPLLDQQEGRGPSWTITGPDGLSETIAAKGAASKTVAVRWTMWGPIVWKDARGREYAQRWLAHDAKALASDPGITGVVVDPAGPWIELGRTELAPVIALAG